MLLASLPCVINRQVLILQTPKDAGATIYLKAYGGKEMPSDTKTVLCADQSAERLQELVERLQSEGFAVLVAHSAAEGISLTAKHHPHAVLLDQGLLYVDHENIPEYLQRVNPGTSIIITAEDPSAWSTQPPGVQAVANRENLDALVSMLNERRA
jgi:PleD family two-component response regulator